MRELRREGDWIQLKEEGFHLVFTACVSIKEEFFVFARVVLQYIK